MMLTAVTGGCGTVHDLRGQGDELSPARVYGGVCLDAEGVTGLLGDTTGGHGGLPGRAVQIVMGSYLLAVDLPLCAVADTLTLPVTLPVALRASTPNWSAHPGPESSPSDLGTLDSPRGP